MTETPEPGARLVDLCRRAQASLLVVAPFIKSWTLERLLRDVDPRVDLEVVTRWHPMEVAQGVSDLEVFDLATARGGRLRLVGNLHAKLFVTDDDQVLAGSANLTGAALGWSRRANLEFLTEVPRTSPEVERVLSEIEARAVVATADLRRQVEEAAAAVSAILPAAPLIETAAAGEPEGRPGGGREWVPATRHPHDLYAIYAEPDRFGSAAQRTAQDDLTELEIPSGLGEDAFTKLVGSRLVMTPLVRDLDEFLAQRRRFGEVARWLEDRWDVDREQATFAWQTLQRWLFQFLPGRYESARNSYSEQVGVRSPAEQEFEARVSHSNGRPILFLPDRDRAPGLPRGTTRVIAEGQAYDFRFVKIAVNVATRPGATENELPRLLQAWFGPDAGAPGSQDRVIFAHRGGAWTLQAATERSPG